MTTPIIPNIIIEVDGKYWHNYPDGKLIDKIRNDELINVGYKIIRFWENEFNESQVKNNLQKLSIL